MWKWMKNKIQKKPTIEDSSLTSHTSNFMEEVEKLKQVLIDDHGEDEGKRIYLIFLRACAGKREITADEIAEINA